MLALALGAAAHAWFRFRHYIVDDAFISFRYAERLANGHGLTWTPGPPVEGYSDLLWVLLLAAGQVLGLPHDITARVLGVTALVALVVMLGFDPIRLRPEPQRLWASAFAACTGGFAIWAMGGLEPTLVCAFVVAALMAIDRQIALGRGAVGLAVWVGLLIALRVDGFVLAIALLGVAVLRTRSVRPWVAPIFTALVVFLLILAHRQIQYNEWIANTVRIKVAMTPIRVANGFSWVAEGCAAHGAIGLAGLLALIAPACRQSAAWRRRCG